LTSKKLLRKNRRHLASEVKLRIVCSQYGLRSKF